MGQQAELPDTGDSVSQVKQRLKDLSNFDGMAQVRQSTPERYTNETKEAHSMFVVGVFLKRPDSGVICW